MKSYYLNNIRLATAFLEANNLDVEETDVAYTMRSSISLRMNRKVLTDEEYRQVKRVFGPLETVDGYSSKGQVGHVNTPSGLDIKLEIQGVMTCEEVSEDDLKNWTEQDWLEFRERALDGHVKVQKCNDIKGVDASE